jgi:hypothetical protein
LASNSAVPAVERHNKTPIYVTGFTDTHGFLKWLRASCKNGISAHIKEEKLMVVHIQPRVLEQQSLR